MGVGGGARDRSRAAAWVHAAGAARRQDVPVDDAEPLLQGLLEASGASVDWTKCQKPHTAVLQVLMAAGVVPLGPCGDAWIEEWWRGNGGGTHGER